MFMDVTWKVHGIYMEELTLASVPKLWQQHKFVIATEADEIECISQCMECQQYV